MDTSLYTWQIPQGNLSIIREGQGYGLYLNTTEKNIRIEEDNIEVEGGDLDFVNLADKTSEFFMGYLPVITQSKNVFSVIFYEMNVIDFKAASGINKTLQFNALEEKVLLSFSPTAPAYRRVIPGLNLEGKCATGGCDADGKVVYIPIGISGADNKHEIPRLVFEKAICPACQKPVPPTSVTNLGFWKCKYTIDARIDDPLADPEDLVIKKTVVVEDKKFTTFKAGDQKTWVYLDISTESTTRAAMRAARSSPSGSSKAHRSDRSCVLF